MGQQAGDLDLSFSLDGKITTDFSNTLDDSHAIAIQPDGKILLAGEHNVGTTYFYAITRYNIDGSLDSTFDFDGKLIVNIGLGSCIAYGIAIQSDGKIIVSGTSAGMSGDDFSMIRCNTDGSLDSTFGINGKQITNIDVYDDEGFSIALQSDGKIVVAGSSYSGYWADFAVIRFTSEGNLDTTFSGDGIQTTAIGTIDDIGRSVAIQQDGKIVVAGYSNVGVYSNFAIIRYNSDGSIDTSFSGDGIQTTSVSNFNDWGWSVAIQNDGKIIVGGSSFTFQSSSGDFAIVRYNIDGSLDNSFSGDGIQTTSIGGVDAAHSVAIQTDGKILLTGEASMALGNDFALVRYNTDGTLDNSFSSDGKITTDFGLGDDGGSSIAIQSDGKILVGGYAFDGNNYDFAICRYHASIITNADNTMNNPFLSPNIFPNPFINQATLSMIGAVEKKSTLSVYNSLGQFVHLQTISSPETQLNLDLPSGIFNYLIMSESGKLIGIGKFIIR